MSEVMPHGSNSSVSFGRYDPRDLDIGYQKNADARKKPLAKSRKQQPDRKSKHGGRRH